MWKISKRFGCQPTQISRRRERNATARDAINVGNTIEETVNVDEINHVPVEETEPDIEKCTVEKAAVVANGEAAKEFKICTNTGMKKYLWCESVENIFL